MGNATSVVAAGGAIAPAVGLIKGSARLALVPVTITMSNSYATGGDTLVLPAKLRSQVKTTLGVVLLNPKPGGASGNLYVPTASLTAPKIVALSAFGTEVTNATDLSAVTLNAIVIGYA